MKDTTCRLIRRRLLLLISVSLFLLFAVVTAKEEEQDLYKLLGVERTATTNEIKSAYRRKAKDTHPDKRTDQSPEQAAEEFQKVVQAYEVLSDPDLRRRYDRSGVIQKPRHYESYKRMQRQQQQRQPRRGKRRFHTNNNQQHYKPPTEGNKVIYMKDRLDVKQARSRVMNIVSLSQLEAVMLDDNGLLERNLLICFVTPQQVETIADDHILFPYPFAHMSEHGIWWEDLLQTIKVRYERHNEITEFFDIPDGDTMRQSKKPLFMYGRRGQPLSSSFEKIQTSLRKEFNDWVWQQVHVEVTFINLHPHPVEAYWMNGGKANMLFTLQPGENNTQNSMISHEWWFRDARVDTFPGSAHWGQAFAEETMVGIYKMINDTSPLTINIQPKNCLDFSYQCGFWKKKGNCNRRPDFMKEYCPLTCSYCNEKNDALKIMDIKKQKEEIKKRRAEHDEL